MGKSAPASWRVLAFLLVEMAARTTGEPTKPVAAMTWGFSAGGVEAAYAALAAGLPALNATVAGVMVVEASGIPSVSWGSP